MKLDEIKKKKEHVKTINIDLDGVVADFDKGVHDLTGKYPDELSDDDMWNAVDKKQDFYRHLDLMPGAKKFFDDVVALAAKHGYASKILTAIPRRKTMPSAEKDKKAWVKEFLSETIHVSIGPFSHDKWKHAHGGDILIDDRESNIEEWTAKPETTNVGILFKSHKQALKELRALLGEKEEE